MNYREKKKKDPAEKKLKKLSVYIKKYETREAEDLKSWLSWEEEADRRISSFNQPEMGRDMLPSPEEDLYLAGWIGAAATELLAGWKKETLENYFPVAFMNTLRDQALFGNLHLAEENREVLNPEYYLQQGASWIAPVGEGGLMKALYRLGKESGLGFRIESKEVPVRQITIEFCEYLLLHPWELLTGAAFLFTAPPNRISLQELEKKGMICKKVGMITKEKQKLICRGEEESNINRPEPDALMNLLLEMQEV